MSEVPLYSVDRGLTCTRGVQQPYAQRSRHLMPVKTRPIKCTDSNCSTGFEEGVMMRIPEPRYETAD